ncbi:MAG TPA: hypothetical protein K8V21_07610 [Weissella thailandensis]|uniref:hypothetical protein n=1 Tax=Weissella thailandensis TaxID=89061 RepID=UPI001D9E0153|nr:hypothetical protein [Weissella thailandensis]HJG85232.1 hypothetical protein [Weissella thailandensis]
MKNFLLAESLIEAKKTAAYLINEYNGGNFNHFNYVSYVVNDFVGSVNEILFYHPEDEAPCNLSDKALLYFNEFNDLLGNDNLSNYERDIAYGSLLLQIAKA